MWPEPDQPEQPVALMETLPQSAIYAAAAPEHRLLTKQLMDMLSELNRDFHDFKGSVA